MKYLMFFLFILGESFSATAAPPPPPVVESNPPEEEVDPDMLVFEEESEYDDFL